MKEGETGWLEQSLQDPSMLWHEKEARVAGDGRAGHRVVRERDVLCFSLLANIPSS